MEGKAVTEIRDLTIKSMELKEVGGKQYSPVELHRVYSDPRSSAVQVKSLTGILDFLESNVDGLVEENLILHIVDHTEVRVLTKIHGERNERHTVVVAKLDGMEPFPFERFIGQEKFIIKARSMFCPTEDMSALLRYTAKIDTEAKVITSDDGITQNINIKKGSSGVLTEREMIPSLVKLRPYRTFTEAEQPESEFLFRMQSGEGTAECALFDADGGAWRNTARENIAGFFKANDIKIPVIA